MSNYSLNWWSMLSRFVLAASVLVGAWWLVEGVLSGSAAHAHNCVERYGPDAYSYGEAPGANNGHGHFCGIRQSPTTSPPTTAAPTTAAPTTAPPIDRTGQHSSPHSYWHGDHSDRSHCADGNHYYHDQYTEAQACGTAPPAGQHRSPHSYVHDDHPDRSHCPDGNHYYHDQYTEAQACGTAPPAGQHRSPHSYVHDDHPDRSHCPDGNHYYHDRYTYAQSCGLDECGPGEVRSPIGNGSCIPSNPCPEGQTGHYHPAEGADSRYCHAHPPPSECGESFRKHSSTGSNDHVSASTPPCESDSDQVDIGEVDTSTGLPTASYPDNAYKTGACVFDSEYSNATRDSSDRNRLVGDVTYTFRCTYLELPDTFRGVGICLEDYTLNDKKCHRYFDASCYSSSDSSQAYMRDFYQDWEAQVENLAEAGNIYGDDHTCGSSGGVTFGSDGTSFTLEVEVDTFYITDTDSPNTVERIVSGWSVEAEANKPKIKRLPVPGDITHWHGSWSGNWRGAVTLTDTLTFSEVEGGDLPTLPGLRTTPSAPTAPTTTTTAPAAVGSVTGLGGSAVGNSVWLGWRVPTTGPAPTAYRVLRAASGGTEQEVARVGGNAYVDRNVQSGVTYTYRVQAISGTLSGPISAAANVTVP